MILDYNMPYLTGLEVVQAIDNFIKKKKLVEVRPFFVIYTSFFDKRFERACKRNKVDKFLQKPLKIDHLNDVLVNLGFLRAPPN